MPSDDQLEEYIADLQRHIADMYKEMGLPTDHQLQQEFAQMRRHIADLSTKRGYLKSKLNALDQSLSEVTGTLNSRAVSATNMAMSERLMKTPIDALGLSRPIANRLQSDGTLLISDLLRKSEHDLTSGLELEPSQVQEVVERLRVWGLKINQED